MGTDAAPNRQNVELHCVHTPQGLTLFLFVDLHKSISRAVVGKCENISVEDYPFTLNFDLKNIGGSTQVNQTIKKLEGIARTSQHSADDPIRWSLEPEGLMRIEVSLRGLIASAQHAPSDEMLHVECRNQKVGTRYMFTLNVATQGQSSWPSPPISQNPERLSSENPVERRLRLDSHETDWLEEDEDGRGGDVVRFGEALRIDANTHEDVRIEFDPSRCTGNPLSTSFIINKDIGVSLSIEVVPRELQPRLSQRFHRTDVRSRPQLPNLRLEECGGSTGMPTTLLIHLDITGEGQSKDLAELLLPTPLRHGDATCLQCDHGNVVIAECSKEIVGRFVVDLTATRAAERSPSVHVPFLSRNRPQIPSEDEVYRCIIGMLGPVDPRHLEDIKLDAVRTYVLLQYDHVVSEIDLEDKQRFKMRIWSCARLYLINRALLVGASSSG